MSFMVVIILTILHIVVIVALPLLLQGVINRTKAFFGGRQGPPLLQPYYDVWRLLQKGTVQSTTTTWLFRFGPIVSLVTVFIAALFIPLGQNWAPCSFYGDVLLFAYVLALGRFFLVLSALDTGSAFEGMGVSRDVTFACLAEPTMFFCILVLAKVFDSLQMADLFNAAFTSHIRTAVTPVLLIFVSWYLLMLAENCRIPFDDPNTHLELTMIHEVIVLDHSGPMLAVIQIASAIKLFVFAALGVRLVLPSNFGNPVAEWMVFLVGVIVMAITLGIVESTMARLRMNKVPQMLTAAGVTAAFSFILLVTTR